MNVITAYRKIKTLQVAIFTTQDAGCILGISNKYAHKLLKQLQDENLLLHLRRGLWAFKEGIDVLMLPDYLTAPAPSYISLQSALYYHGLISQIPTVIYAISIARSRVYETTIGTYSIHHIAPQLFMGFNTVGENDIRMAEVEKALFDFFYLKASKSKLFYRLPELEIPDHFSWEKFESYIDKVKNKSRRAMIIASQKAFVYSDRQ